MAKNAAALDIGTLTSNPVALHGLIDEFFKENTEKNQLDKECKPKGQMIKASLIGMAAQSGRDSDGMFVVTPNGHKALLSMRSSNDFDQEAFYQGVLAMVSTSAQNKVRELKEACTSKSQTLTLKVT